MKRQVSYLLPLFFGSGLRSAHVRDHLVPVAGTGDRFDRSIARYPPRDVHGRDVPGKPLAPPVDLPSMASAAGVRGIGSGHRRSGQKAELATWLDDAQINRDRNLRLQYLSGIGKYSFEMADLHRELDRFRKFPDSLFVASDAWKDELRRTLDASPEPKRRFH